MSFWGIDGSEADSVISLTLALFLFLITLSVLRDNTDLAKVLRIINWSVLITLIIFWFNLTSILVFKKSPIQFLGIVGGNGFSTLGGIGLLSSFVGFGFLVSLLALVFPFSTPGLQTEESDETAGVKPKKRPSVLALATLLLSFFVIIATAHRPTLVALVATLVASLILALARWKKMHLFQFNIITFFIFCFALLYFIRLPLGAIFNLPVEVALSPIASFDIAIESLKESPLKAFFGSGPVTYVQQYLKHKPVPINSTLFWNFDFRQGFSFWLSFVVTFGLFGSLALFLFFLSLLFKTVSVFVKTPLPNVSNVSAELNQNGSEHSKTNDQKSISVSSTNNDGYLFFTALVLFIYFFVLSFVYTFNFILLSFLLVVTALVIIATALATDEFYNAGLVITEVNIRNLLTMLPLMLLLIGSLALFIYGAKRYIANVIYGQVLQSIAKNGNVDDVLPRLQKAFLLYPTPEFARSVSSLWFAKLRQRLNQVNTADVESMKPEIQRYFNNAIDSTKIAISSNPQDYISWSHFGGLYETLIPIVQGANTLALQGYLKVQELNPRNPIPYLQAARIEIISANSNLKSKEAAFTEAEKYLQQALKLKSDYLDAGLLLSQIYQQTGRMSEAIRITETALAANPQNIDLLFQLGFLKYTNGDLAGAKQAFFSLLSLSPNYSNAKYYLGLIYDKEGNKEAAIKEFDEILQLNPGNQEVMKILKNLKAGLPAI
jgi:tetratricopeptide (TPR) repeat protein